LPPPQLPELEVAREPRAIAVSELRLVRGESLVWDIHAQGFTIARAELSVGEGEATSRFRTGTLASSFARASHDLTTRFAGGRPLHAFDNLDIEGERTSTTARFAGPRIEIESRVVTVPGGNLGHTLHTALGVIRAWASPDARPGFLYIVHANAVFRLDVGRPMREAVQGTPALRIEGRIREPAIGLTIWLRARDLVPVRVEIRGDEAKLTAELVAD
jgi:hypothetical protein